MNRIDDPPLQEEASLEPYDPTTIYQGAIDQAYIVATFLKTLEGCGLSHDEALWLTAQFWRAS
jgi:hypothetical protein